MRIIKYLEYIRENQSDTPETYIALLLKNIQDKIQGYFIDNTDSDNTINKFDNHYNKKRIENGDMSFKDMGIELQSSEVSKYSSMNDNLKVIFSDSESRYDLIITINTKDAVRKDEESDFSIKEIKKAFIKFKKYDISDNRGLIGEITKTINPKDIDEDMLISLKIELDEMFGLDSSSELEIETE